MCLLGITVIFVVLGGVKQIYDGYKEAERQIELQKQKMELTKKESEKKFKYVSKDKFDAVTAVLDKEVICWSVGATTPEDRKAVEGLALQLTTNCTGDFMFTLDKDSIKKREDQISQNLMGFKGQEYDILVAEMIATCPIYHAQVLNLLQSIPSVTAEDVKVLDKKEVESRKSK
ncbi:hypothetical protein KLEP7_gp191 [Pseudaeromonas phage vB_PpeM_ KLEP7]|nr:hypothetical protein KLEP7_gp191 [Pseudaeromonas phage vB_PpeM_ KLEP7]